MSGRRRTKIHVEAERRNREQMARLGGIVRDARHRRRLTQAAVASRVGLSRMAISRAERGLGGGLTLDVWQRISLALGIRL
jgi:transcriptional regulator with XRE-family HTH domain